MGPNWVVVQVFIGNVPGHIANQHVVDIASRFGAVKSGVSSSGDNHAIWIGAMTASDIDAVVVVVAAAAAAVVLPALVVIAHIANA